MVLSIKNINLDLRPFHVLKEHKKIIKILYEYLYINQLLQDAISNITDYSDLLRKAEILLNMILKYQFSREQPLLVKACNLLNEIKDSELTLLGKIERQVKVVNKKKY